MRIIAGTAKGVRLARPAGATRPVSDRAREGIFSSLAAEIPGARCLDLYAGTGAMGIEALSRGAASCDLVDAEAKAIRVIRQNLRLARVEDRGRAVQERAERFLRRPGDPYDLAFADPPYEEQEERLRVVLTALSGRIARDGTFVLTRGSRSSMDVIPVDWRVERRLSYGDTLVLVCREEP